MPDLELSSMSQLPKRNTRNENAPNSSGIRVSTFPFTSASCHRQHRYPGAATGTTINGIGADFTQSFLGQSVSGTSLTGAPTNPLTLQASGTITVASFDPGVSPAGNSLLSQPGNLAPLAVLLDTLADSFDRPWVLHPQASTILASLYDGAGALVGSQSIVMINGYGLYSLSGLGSFRGIAFSNNNDPSG
ncbi:MAG: hypothetical protein IPP87_21750, partial [Ideonella sp.]|nr:hypothetical protein [Ideonella sp.]